MSFGIREFIKQAWSLQVERAKVHKALRMLESQTWSVEFLTALLVRAAKLYGTGLEMTITSKDGHAITVRSVDKVTERYKDDDIFNNLDDEVKIQQFIAQLQRK